MNSIAHRIVILAVASLFCLNAPAESTRKPARFGLLEIGDVADQQMKRLFVKTDCGTGQWAFGDCSGTDKAGREYAFFGGIVVIVSLNAKTARPPVRLPGGLIFGEDITRSASRLAKAYQVAIDGGPNSSGEISYETDMVIPSRSGTRFQIVLIADERGKLVEFRERINSV